MSMSEKQKQQIEQFSQLHFQHSMKSQIQELIVPEPYVDPDETGEKYVVEEVEVEKAEKSVKLSPLQVMRAALNTVAIHNWSLFA